MLAGAGALAPGAAAQAVPPDDPARGFVHAGLRQRPTGPCRNGFELVHGRAGRTLCTHGPDPAPAGMDVRTRRPPRSTLANATLPGTAASTAPAAGTAAQAGAAIQCYDDGTSGPRVQLVDARAADVADRYTDYATTFRQIAADVDRVFVQSAAETGGLRHVRYVTDSGCTPIVARVTLTSTGDDNIDNTISELQAQGYDRPDRKYLVWTDANVYCGIAQVYDDDKPGPGNYHNANATISGMVARVDNGCWGVANQLVEAHELMHTLGGVQYSAPHGTFYNHCTDEYDRMCYSDGSGKPLVVTCSSTTHEALFDCNHDDYFSTSAPAVGYLATHWNAANSVFLAAADGAAPSGTAASGARYHPLTPSRILDTRNGTGSATAPVGGAASIDLQVTGRGGVPASGVSAVVMNVAVTNPLLPSYLTVWPTGEARPLASNLNYLTAQTVPNLVTAKLGTGGKVSMYNASGTTDVVADVAGWFDDA
jgi:hypothetical protein